MKKETSIQTIGHIAIDASRRDIEPNNESLYIIPTRDFVLFPGVTFPISLGRKPSLDTARRAHESGEVIGVVCQRDAKVEMPDVASDLQPMGVYADVLQVIELPDETYTAIVRAHGKFTIEGPANNGGGRLAARVKPVRESRPRATDKEFFMLARAIKESMFNIVNRMGGGDDMKINLENIDDAGMLINLIATHAPIDTAKKVKMLAQSKLKERAFILLTELSKNERLMEIDRDIQLRTRTRIDEGQRNAFLQQQMEAIRQELYGDDNDAGRLREKAASVALTPEARSTFDKEVARLEHLAPQSPEYAVSSSYLELLLDLPWGVEDAPTTDFAAAEARLEADHYGLEKVKERILEQIAVTLNNPAGHAPILCLVGAPGVGKTSLGQSIAAAMGRRYRRVALGGLHDEAEIRGHRRTYIGAMPGRIIDSLRRTGSSNPVLLLDEIDKVGADFKGDPSAALLEVLDPEQNCRFHDNYVDVDFDLSKVMFIATANSLQSIPQPLIDRMEVIEIPGYMPEEKIEIARRHLLPRLLKENNLPAGEISIPDDTLSAIISGYTAESGVRRLEKALAKIVRKHILQKARGEIKEPNVTLTPDMLKNYLGVAPLRPDRYEGNDIPGVVTGLAWTAAGGEILYIEATAVPAKNPALHITGNLGDVMKESATISLRWVQAHAEELGISPSVFDERSIHIHAPEGAVPKDGPSAGVTIVTAITSILSGKKVKPRTAMTGEATLRGKVLPVGGIKEKILAARRAGITDVILPFDNRRDVEEIDSHYLTGLTFHYVKTLPEVLSIAL